MKIHRHWALKNFSTNDPKPIKLIVLPTRIAPTIAHAELVKMLMEQPRQCVDVLP